MVLVNAARTGRCEIAGVKWLKPNGVERSRAPCSGQERRWLLVHSKLRLLGKGSFPIAVTT